MYLTLIYQNFTFYLKMSMHRDGFMVENGRPNSFQPASHVPKKTVSTLLLAVCVGFGCRLNLGA